MNQAQYYLALLLCSKTQQQVALVLDCTSEQA
jgi:hypothetical protein